jgi:uncharacterized membrane protein YgcG
MAMVLGRISPLRHVVVGATALGSSLLALSGVVGSSRPEVFESKQVTVSPAGPDGVRIREVVDYDFGRNKRRGYRRTIPNDFGTPTEVTAQSETAPDDVDVTDGFDESVIRIGDPNVTITGQHRYVVTYTLPQARLSLGDLALDIIGNDETLTTKRFEIIVTGLDLADPQCNIGLRGRSGGCSFTQTGNTYRTVIEPLKPGQGVTIGGAVIRRSEPAAVAVPPLPKRVKDTRKQLAAGVLATNALAGGAVFRTLRRKGRNEVVPGGAAEAAYGPSKATGRVPSGIGGMPVILVPDDQMDELATTEFAPPKGIEPWQGAALLSEQVDDSTVSAFLSTMVAKEALSLRVNGHGNVVLSDGPRRNELIDGAARDWLDRIVPPGQTVTTGAYSPTFSAAWAGIRHGIDQRMEAANWWIQRSSPAQQSVKLFAVAGALFFFVISATSNVGIRSALASGPVIVLIVSTLLCAAVAFGAYRFLLARRTAEGSALAIRTESFRRFLQASEGRHVEWAWNNGLLREYSAWAVALGAAEAWGKALERSNVPRPDHALGSPMIIATHNSSMRQSRVEPPSTSSGGGGGGGGGGFSGGSVGGGGGGGSSGSW